MWRELLRPSPWMLVAVGCLWAWRAGALWLRTRFGFELEAALLPGFVWDALLAAGLLLLARASGLAGSGRRLRIATLAGLIGLSAVAFFIRAADLAHCSMTGGHWNSAGFLYLQPENWALVAELGGPPLLALWFGSVALTSLALWMEARAAPRHAREDAESPGWPRTAGAGAILLALPLLAGVGGYADRETRFVPEANFAYEWLVWQGIRDDSAAPVQLSPQRLARLVEVGLAPAAPVRPDYPFLRPTLDPTPFPYPVRPYARGRRPNVVLTLVEQLNHDFVYSFSGELEGVMPRLSALSQRMTRVTNYRSTASPTIHALVAVLCSIHSSAHTRELNAGRGSEELVHTPISCLPEILRQQGYRTVFVQGGTKEFAGKGEFLAAHGFEEVHGKAELQQRFEGAHVSRWGLHDNKLVQYAAEQIVRLERLRKQDGRPYFLAMLTLDSHFGIPPPNCRMPDEIRYLGHDRDSKRMIRSLRCTDWALGELGSFIMDDPVRSRDTIWTITGDHPTRAMRFLLDIYERRGQKYDHWYGRLPWMIYDPTHDLPSEVDVLSGHTDLAPTLLHLLGIRDVPNSMTGHSIFGRRPQYPMLVGRTGPQYVALYGEDQVRNVTMNSLQRLCLEGEKLLPDQPGALDACELLDFIRWQNYAWREKRLLPPEYAP